MGLFNIFGSKTKAPVLPVDFQVTLWPAFNHFLKYAQDDRIQGIRLNSAMMDATEIDDDFVRRSKKSKVPLWFDIKGMQLRIREVISDPQDPSWDHLEFILNRPVDVPLPTTVNFKGGEDAAQLIEIKDGGRHLVFKGGPKYEVRAGESIHIRDPRLKVSGPVFLDYELEKINKIINLGFTNYYLSYVWSQNHVDEFRSLIGKDANLRLKIENKTGLEWVANGWKPQANTSLTAARGDLYVEVDRPHHVMDACRLIIEKDPTASVGSRMLLSLVPPPQRTKSFLYWAKKRIPALQAKLDCLDSARLLYDDLHNMTVDFQNSLPNPDVPSCADFSDLSWLYDIGYRSFLLCDELCLKDDLLGTAVSVFDSWKSDYAEQGSYNGSNRTKRSVSVS